MRHNNLRQNERGMALILSLLALLLVSAVGLGMIYMSNTETSINANYKDTQVAFFAMRAGLEEARERMRYDRLAPIHTPPNSLPTKAFPPAANSIVYIINPRPGETVDPANYSTTNFFDDEFCHEYFPNILTAYYVDPATGTACASSTNAPPATAWEPYINSNGPNSGTNSALKYKWVRVTLKQNGTTGRQGVVSSYVDPSQPAANQVCWDAVLYKERVSSAITAGATTCDQVTSSNNVEPVYLVTSLAVTPSGSRRVGQYDVAAFNIAPPPGGLTLDGPTPVFGPPNSNGGGINGNDQSGPPPATPLACGTNLGAHPAVGTDTALDATSVSNQITGTPGTKPANFSDTGSSTPTVTSDQSTLGNWSTVQQLNNIVTEMSNVANVTCPGSAKCSLPLGTAASPQITFVNGNLDMTQSGAGILVVTGNLTLDGSMSFDGLILVIGTGNIQVNGGGGGSGAAIYAELFAAHTTV